MEEVKRPWAGAGGGAARSGGKDRPAGPPCSVPPCSTAAFPAQGSIRETPGELPLLQESKTKAFKP